MVDDGKEIWIFLSHSSADFDKVRLIRNYLEEKSFRPLMFYLKCLESEEETYNLITREIDVRTRFILCDSENARASKWVKKEMDYITNADPKRSYSVIDLSKPIEQLKSDIDAYTNTFNIFVSYSRNQEHIFDIVRNRLMKYDLRVYSPKEEISLGVSFASQIKEAIATAAKCGYYILLADDNSVNSRWVQEEFTHAVNSNARIFIITLSVNVDQYCRNTTPFSRYKIVSLYGSYTQGTDADRVADIILSLVMSPGAIMTHAENFRTGKNSVADIKEADRMDRVLIQAAEESPNPAALVFLAECYEYGKHGLSKDLRKASEYYSLAIHEGGREDLIPHAREINEQIYGNHTSSNRSSGPFLKRIINWLKRN